MVFEHYTERNWLTLLMLCILGAILLIHGSVILVNLHYQQRLFISNTALDSIGSCAEITAGLIFLVLGVFQDSVVEELNGFLDSIHVR